MQFNSANGAEVKMIYTEGMTFDKKTKKFTLEKEWVNNNVMRLDLTTVDESALCPD